MPGVRCVTLEFEHSQTNRVSSRQISMVVVTMLMEFSRVNKMQRKTVNKSSIPLFRKDMLRYGFFLQETKSRNPREWLAWKEPDLVVYVLDSPPESFMHAEYCKDCIGGSETAIARMVILRN